MNFLTTTLREKIIRLKTNGVLTVIYALLLEALFIGYIYFAGFFTLEMLLPTLVTDHLDLTKFFFLLFLFSCMLAFLGHILDLHFDWNMHKKNPLLWIGLIWCIGILTLSMLDFPPLLIPLLIIAFLTVGYLFWKILLHEE